MLDTKNIIKSRVVINMQTKYNINQAVAENLGGDISHADRMNKSMEKHSDYADILWIQHFNPGFTMRIHIESGTVHYNDKQLPTYSPGRLKVKPYEYKQHLLNWSNRDMEWAQQPMLLYSHGHYEIVDWPSESNEFYRRSELNRLINNVYVVIDPVMSISTCSRRCEFNFNYLTPYETSIKFDGAMIRQSDDNILDHLEQVID